MEEIRNDNRYTATVNHGITAPLKHRRSGPWIWLGLVLMIAVMVTIVAVIQSATRRNGRDVPQLPASRDNVAAVSQPSPAELSRSFREVVKSVKDAVVYIDVVEKVTGGNDDDSPFGIPSPNTPRRREGAGSGFVVTEDGYILTNNHVIRNATKISVTLADGRKYKAEVIGADPDTDIAVIKIDERGLPIAVLGDSEKIQQGDWVLALGSPFGLQQTLTAGIVSATGREMRDSQYTHYIQTDASINPGNSGGPLVDMTGQVVGINTLILTGGPFSQGNIGIGFAISANEARGVFNQLVKAGRVTRGYLGVRVADLDSAKAHSLGLETNQGVFVADIPQDGPAGKAGLMPKDVITSFNGKPVKAARELTDIVASTAAGSTAKIDFIRDGKPQSVSVQLVERPKEIATAVIPQSDDNDGSGSAIQSGLGITAQTVTPELAERSKLKTPSGAMVVSVAPGLPAADAGITHGDVIHRLDRFEIKSAEDLTQAVKSLKSGDFMVEVERKGQVRFITITID
jgi:serine protease Do